MENIIKIIIVDDHDLIRHAVKQMLSCNSRLNVIEECEDGGQAIEAVRKLKPDVVIMDIEMKPVNGFKATEQICKEAPAVKVVAYSNNDEVVYAKKMFQLGAKGFVTKGSRSEELVTAIFSVYAGQEFVCEEIQNKINSYRQ